MKKQITKIALFALVAAALVAAPATLRAADNGTNKAAATAPAKKHGTPPLHGKVAAVDAAAMTVTVGQSTVTVTSETKITKDGKPATLADITVGTTVVITSKKDDTGKLTATAIRAGEKAAPKGENKKQKSE